MSESDIISKSEAIRQKLEESGQEDGMSGPPSEEVLQAITFDEFIMLVKGLAVGSNWSNSPGGYDADLVKEYIQEILENHPEYVNQKDEDGKTALMLLGAAKEPDNELGESLIEDYNADIFITDKAGKTAAQYYKENPNMDADEKKDIMKVFANVGKERVKGSKGFIKVSEEEDKNDPSVRRTLLSKLPAEVRGEISRNITGVKGSTKTQQTTLRKATTGKGRKRKTRKARKTKKSTRRRA
jgi:hypothetical protein